MPRRPVVPKDLLTAVQGDQRAALTALRDTLARSIDAVENQGQVAALAKQLRETLAALEKLRPAEKASPVDQIASRRAARLAAASVPARSKGKVDGGAGGGGAGGQRRAGTRTTSGARARGGAG